MQLLGSLFEILDSSEQTGSFSTSIKFFPGHEIFKAHFPGYPVTPGVVFLQLVHELLEKHLGEGLRLIEVSRCKFLKVVNPEEEPLAQILVSVAHTGQDIRVKAVAQNNAGTIFKLNAVYGALAHTQD